MKVLLDEQGYIQSYALIGEIVDSIEIPDPEDVAHFAEHFTAYKVRDGTAAFDNEHFALQEQERVKEDYRQRRETECFAYINRGELWYSLLTDEQKAERANWYLSWLDAPETRTIPAPPVWLDKL